MAVVSGSGGRCGDRALAGVVGLVVAALLTPVMGIVAGLAVAVWILIRKGAGDSRGERGSAATA